MCGLPWCVKPTAILCKILQNDELCIECNWGYSKNNEINGKAEIFQNGRLSICQKGIVEAKSVELLYHHQGLAFLNNKYTTYIDSVLTCLHARVKYQNSGDVDLITQALKILATHEWENTDDDSFG